MVQESKSSSGSAGSQRDGQRKSKRRMEEINRKGEKNQGSNTDAFLPKWVSQPSVEPSGKAANASPLAQRKALGGNTMDKDAKKEERAPAPSDTLRPPGDGPANDVGHTDKKADSRNSDHQNSKDKYEYKPDPAHSMATAVEVKRQYDRDFLLDLQYSQNSMTRPVGLPHLPEIVLNEPHSEGKMRRGPGQSMGQPDFTPGFFKPQPGRGPMGGHGSMTKRGSQSGPKNQGPRVIQYTRTMEEVKLHQAEKAWKPNFMGSKAPENQEEEIEVLRRKFRALLNKLTPQNFPTVLSKTRGLPIHTEEQLDAICKILHEKAINEPGFSVAYANLCKAVGTIKVPKGSSLTEYTNARALLLTYCQREFESSNQSEILISAKKEELEKADTEEKRQLIKEEVEALMSQLRRRSTGNIRFIGELFKLKMLTENIMHDCIYKLLKAETEEENLECLCGLLKIAGADLDTDKAKARMDQYFNTIQRIIDQRSTSSRIRFMLRDTVDLRKDNWVPRRSENTPKTIAQVHQEFNRETIEKQMNLQNAPPPPRGGRGSKSQRNQQNEEGWNTVVSTSKSMRNNLDPSKLKFTKTQVDDNIQLGPGGGGMGRMGWSRGSSGGSARASQEADRPSTPSNRFSALSREDDSRSRAFGRGSGLSPARGDSKGRSQGSSRAKNLARSSQEQERQSLIQTTRNIAGGRKTPPSQGASRENSRSRDDYRAAAQQRQPDRPPMSREKIEGKAKAILDEYLHIHDKKEAFECVAEIHREPEIHAFVAYSISSTLERQKEARKRTGELLQNLLTQELLSLPVVLKGLREILEIAEDLAVDIPKVFEYLAELISPLIVLETQPKRQERIMHELGMAIAQDLKECDKAKVLMVMILRELLQKMTHSEVKDLWERSQLQWSDFLQAGENEEEFLTSKSLDFMLPNAPPSPAPVQNVTGAWVEQNLSQLLTEPTSDNEIIFSWIEQNVPEEFTRKPEFIRALMTAVCRTAVHGNKVNVDVIKNRQPLLRKYLQNSEECEIQALFALQALVHSMQHPPGVLREFFDILYDEDLISEEGFMQWEKNDDPQEQEGKGVALKQVVQFFAWLQEADDDPTAKS